MTVALQNLEIETLTAAIAVVPFPLFPVPPYAQAAYATSGGNGNLASAGTASSGLAGLDLGAPARHHGFDTTPNPPHPANHRGGPRRRG